MRVISLCACVQGALGVFAMQEGLRFGELAHYPHLQLFQTSVVKGTGYTEAFRWIAGFV